MPKAEVGSTKYVANKMKAKGLQRLRWYCQICEKQCRDENGFKQHTMSESHVRNMLQVGEDPKKYINEYSNQFKRDFLRLLKTSHGEKKVHMNNFYQEYIRDKEHVHMNSTKWPSLTEFAKFLGREGLCRVEEGERGLEISFIDDSADAVTRREAIKRSEREAKGSEDLESKLLNEQIKRAREAAKEQEKIQAALRKGDEKEKPNLEEVSKEPVKLSFSLGAKAAPKPTEAGKEAKADEPVAIDSFSAHDTAHPPSTGEDKPDTQASAAPSAAPAPAAAPKISLGGLKSRKSNPLMGGGKKTNALAGKKAAPMPEPEKKMSNTERIMREEMEQKRLRDERGGGGKRQRMG